MDHTTRLQQWAKTSQFRHVTGIKIDTRFYIEFGKESKGTLTSLVGYYRKGMTKMDGVQIKENDSTGAYMLVEKS